MRCSNKVKGLVRRHQQGEGFGSQLFRRSVVIGFIPYLISVGAMASSGRDRYYKRYCFVVRTEREIPIPDESADYLAITDDEIITTSKRSWEIIARKWVALRRALASPGVGEPVD